MKATLFFCSLFLIGFLSYSQNIPKEIPKGTTKIIVITDLAAKENYSKVITTLLDQDFEIEKKDPEFYTVKTGLKPYNNSGTYYLNFRCKDNSIEITGQFNAGISIEISGVRTEDTFSLITNKGMIGSLSKISFEEMYKKALLFGENLTFQN